jgi:hypothetical protein
MKTRDLSILCFAFLCAGLSARAQGNFQNLGFESATIVPLGTEAVYFAQAFPGWTGSIEGVQQSSAWYDSLTMSSAGFSIIDSNYVNISFEPGGVIQGNFTAVVMSGLSGVEQPSAATLSQTGLVPAGMESLLFKALFENFGTLASFDVTLGGQTLSLVPVASGANYTLYGADISAWAGQTAELDFTAFPDTQHELAAYLYLDSIQSSDLPIPEPGVFGLSVLGALLLGWRALGRRG